MTTIKFTTTLSLVLALSSVICINCPSFAQNNDFFGGGMPSSGGGMLPNMSSPGEIGAAAAASKLPVQGGGDYTDDEKRMQKKFKLSVKRAKELIAKGESMMAKNQKQPQGKNYKKGKIFQEIGQKQLAELKANSPFPELDFKAPGKNKKGLAKK